MIESGQLSIPMTTTWYLSDIGKAQGLQELFTKQSPQRLKVLRKHAVAQSVVSSNRIEGVEIDKSRIGTLVFGSPSLKDRDEEEVHGYREALNLIHSRGSSLPISEKTILNLHKLCRGDIWDAGCYKDKPVDIIERRPDGSQFIRFRSVSPEKTPQQTQKLTELWSNQYRDHQISPLIVMAAFNLDFLCIHPFRDGNGRVSRLLLLLTCYYLGIEVGRYISLERLIEENKERYYETLQQSSQGWHEGKHNPWPYIGYLLFIIKEAYNELEAQVGQTKAQKGEKTTLVETAIKQQTGLFTVSDIRDACPGVGVDLIRKILSRLKGDKVECLGRGQSAQWKWLN